MIERLAHEDAEIIQEYLLNPENVAAVAAFKKYLRMMRGFFASAQELNCQILALKSDASLTRCECEDKIYQVRDRINRRIWELASYVSDTFQEFTLTGEVVGDVQFERNELLGIGAFGGLRKFLKSINERCSSALRLPPQAIELELANIRRMYEVALEEATIRENLKPSNKIFGVVVPGTRNVSYEPLFPEKESIKDLVTLFLDAHRGYKALLGKVDGLRTRKVRESTLTFRMVKENKPGTISFFAGRNAFESNFIRIAFSEKVFSVEEVTGSFSHFVGNKYRRGSVPDEIWNLIIKKLSSNGGGSGNRHGRKQGYGKLQLVAGARAA